jgi:hypothetical protein
LQDETLFLVGTLKPGESWCMAREGVMNVMWMNVSLCDTHLSDTIAKGIKNRLSPNLGGWYLIVLKCGALPRHTTDYQYP